MEQSMAATYSSFMTTRFYSPVFNTALFDGPIRIYFSQSYESAALKIYHLLQTQHVELWQQLKECSIQSKDHVFLIMYPEPSDVEMVFADSQNSVQAQEWEEGLAIGFSQPRDDIELTHQLDQITKSIGSWVRKNKTYEASL